MRIIFIGPPGAGKGTQAGRLVDYLSAVHLSTGEMLRTAIAAGTLEGQEAESFVKQGNLAPDDLVLNVIRRRLEELGPDRNCLFDGFPRTLTQAKSLDRLLAEHSRPVNLVLVLNIEDEEIVRRLVGRAEAEQRSDDSPETIRERMNVYRNRTKPLIDFYQSRGMLYAIDGMGTPAEVFDRIRQRVDMVRQRAG